MRKLELSRIQECILNIDMVCRSMYATNRDIRILKIPPGSVIYADLLRYSYIQLCTILDEIQILQSLAKNDDYLKDTLYVISPAIRAINKYNGIRKARNYMLAHFNRDKKRNFYPWWKALKQMKLPRTRIEISEIFTYLHAINGIIVTTYYNELKEFSVTTSAEVDEYFKWMKEQDINMVNNLTPFNKIGDEIEKRMIEKNISGIIVDPYMTELIDIVKEK